VTVLGLAPVGGTLVDGALAVVTSATLVRRPEGAFVEVALPDVARVVQALAFAGIAAGVCEIAISPPHSLVPAIGRDLGPLPRGLIAHDVVRVRRLALGEATREVLRRRFGRLPRPSADARARARALLHGEDALLAWDRRAWGSRVAVIGAEARACLRPIVFDRVALERAELRGRTFASAGSLGRWLFS
jgi:hypothetical protein